MRQNYSIYQVFLLILSILFLNYCMLWGFHYFDLTSYPDNEIYILGLTYLIIIIVSAFIAKATNLTIIHSVMGLCRTSSKAIIISLIAGILLWISDYLYQIYFLQNDLSYEAKQWLTSHSEQIITFISMVIIAPIIEEILLRGILFQSLLQYMNKILAIIIVSLVFTMLHDSYAQWPALFIASILYCWLTFHYKSILPSIVAHIINNALTFVLYRLLIT